MGFLFLPTYRADKTDSLIIRYFDSARNPEIHDKYAA